MSRCKLQDNRKLTVSGCDTEIKKLCSMPENKSNPFCGCYNVPPEKIEAIKKATGNFIVNPKFWYVPCISPEAYKNEETRNAPAPNLNICNMQQKIDDVTILADDSVDANMLTQHCSISSNPSQDSSPSPSPSPSPRNSPNPISISPSPSPSTTSGFSKTTIIGIVLFVGFLLIAMLMVMGGGGVTYPRRFNNLGYRTQPEVYGRSCFI